MGRWASTFQMPALLALKYDLPVLPIFSHPEPDGTIFVRVEPALQLPRSENAERDLWMATQLMTWAIESQIHRDPRYWFWMHRRFKTRPGEGNPLPSPLPPQEWVDALPAPTHWA
jgi:KDO2-lipid IV(A) lauroyltransferase